MKIYALHKDKTKKLLCLPGLFMNSECFVPLSKCLPEFCVVAVTYDAHDKGTKFISFEQEIKKIENGLVAKGLDDFDVVLGTSIGAQLAVLLLNRGNIKTDRLILDGLKSYRIGEKERLSLSVQFYVFMMISRCNIDFLRCTYSRYWARQIARCARNMTWESLRNYVKDFVSFEISEGLPSGTMVLYGGNEKHNQDNIKHLKKVSPNTEINIKERYGHLNYLDDNPEKYAEMIRGEINMAKEDRRKI